jgi:undecaprenyl-diphosphatase
MEFLEILKIIFLGIVEGITEWLPVSSTGHLLLVDELFTLQASDDFKSMFTIVVQLGAILAVPILFWNKLFPFSFAKKDGHVSLVSDKKILSLWGKVLVGCVPAGVTGVLFDDFLEQNLHTPLVISLALIVYGIAFILIEKSNERKTLPIQTTDEITYKHALLIGLFQVLSLIPGTSRSGATIIGALLLGISRPAGAEFTFFLAIPVMIGASAIKILKFLLANGSFTGTELGYLLIGTLVAFAVSLLVIKFLMNFVKKHTFAGFGYYRIVLGLLIIILLVLV